MRLLLPAMMALMVVLQVYQVYQLESLHSDRDWMNVGGNSRSLTQSHDDQRSGNDTIAAAASSKTAVQSEEAFSACLMIMDDNAHLIEWLAYHYLKLPLRRLIVAVDPRSQTTPTEIFKRWEGLMDITEWHEVDFMPPTLMDRHLTIDASDNDALTTLFRQRQEEFYTRCMARLKYEGRTWTAFVDTDEYILINQNAMEGYRIVPFQEQSTPQALHMTLLEGIHKLAAAADAEGTATSSISQEYRTSPCLAMARIAFGVKESLPQEVQRNVPFGFGDGKDFQTLRWRWHAGRGSKKVNKISKSILDVSRIDSSLFVPHEQVMVHLPSKTYCHGGSSREQHLWVLNAHSPIVTHHYAATWEQWSHRKDTRGKRTFKRYQEMALNVTTDDRIRPWLQQFVDEVGWWSARRLLRGVGKLSES